MCVRLLLRCVLVFGPLILWLQSNEASAADFNVTTLNDGKYGLLINGPIVSGDAEKFSLLIENQKISIVALQSPGGSLIDGIGIGEKIRLKNLPTVVTGGSVCASACALAWLGGTRRFMQLSSLIGFHAASNEAGQETGIGNAFVGAYLQKIGISYAGVGYITIASPQSMNWLTVSEAARVGIDIQLLPLQGEVVYPAIANPIAPSPQTRPATIKPPERVEAEKGPILSATKPNAFSSIESEVQSFIDRYMGMWSNSQIVSAEYAKEVYALSLRYYNSDSTIDKIVEEQSKFIKRWPNRDYKIKVGSQNIRCASPSNCDFTAVVTWTAKSNERNAISVGSATWHLSLEKNSTSWKITEEDGVTLDRKISKLSDVSDTSSWYLDNRRCLVRRLFGRLNLQFSVYEHNLTISAYPSEGELDVARVKIDNDYPIGVIRLKNDVNYTFARIVGPIDTTAQRIITAKTITLFSGAESQFVELAKVDLNETEQPMQFLLKCAR